MDRCSILSQWRPVIADELFRRYSFLEFYTFDGGGGFVNRALLGSVESREIADLILNRNKLESFGELPELDFRRYERWRSIEKSCWINRCYFLPALAQVAWLDSDRQLAEMVKRVMLRFLSSCPPPENIAEHWRRVRHRMEYDYNRKTREEFRLDETDVEYVWYDFQVASRLINFFHALYFIRDLAVFTPEESGRLRNGLLTHGRVIYEQETHLEYARGNHQSVRQTALLHAAAMAPDVPEYRRWAEFAIERAVRHILEDFDEDGSLKEYAPSYHAFETWHGRDDLILAERLGLTIPAEAAERIRRAGQVLNAYRRPDGLTLAINDAYPLAPDALLESLGIDLDEPPRHTWLKDGGLAVFRGKRLYAALDCSAYTGEFSHYHAGKNALVVYAGRQAVIDDPGCCDYDDPRFRGCKQGDVHSSLLVDGISDGRSFSIYGFDCWPSVRGMGWSGGRCVSTETSSRPEWCGVRWRRRLDCRDAALTVTDTVSGGAEHEYTFHFVLAPEVAAELQSASELLLTAGRERLKMSFRGDCTVVLEPAVNFQTDPSRETLRIAVKCKRALCAELTTVIELLSAE